MSEKRFLNGTDMVEHYGLSEESIAQAKRTCWPSESPKQIWAIGYDCGIKESESILSKYKAALEKAIKLLELPGTQCANTGMYGVLGLRPGECDCSRCELKKGREELKALISAPAGKGD